MSRHLAGSKKVIFIRMSWRRRMKMHDPLMADPVLPTSSRAWFIKDGLRLLYTVALFMADMLMFRISSSLSQALRQLGCRKNPRVVWE